MREDDDSAPQAGALRLDRWLWHARFIRSRDLALGLVEERRLRLNSQPVTKTHALVRPGDVITLTQPRAVRVLKVLALGERRGPASEAQGLYEELEG